MEECKTFLMGNKNILITYCNHRTGVILRTIETCFSYIFLNTLYKDDN
jgi:hypothetical protein